MYHRTLNIKIDESLDAFLQVLKQLGATEGKDEVIYNLIVNVAAPKVFSDPQNGVNFVLGLKDFMQNKFYDNEAEYFVPLQISEELEPFKKIIQIHRDIFPDNSKEFEELTDEVLVLSIMHLCAFMYEQKILETISEKNTDSVTLH